MEKSHPHATDHGKHGLFIILGGVGNRRVMHHVRLAEQSSRRWVRLATGLGMVAVGAVILIWFV